MNVAVGLEKGTIGQRLCRVCFSERNVVLQWRKGWIDLTNQIEQLYLRNVE